MENIKKSELLDLKTKLIKDIRNWKPSEGDAPDCFTILHDYNESVKKLTMPAVIVSLPTVENAGVIAVGIAEINNEMIAQEQAFFIAGFQECVKYLELQSNEC